jgi:hypothetical protein
MKWGVIRNRSGGGGGGGAHQPVEVHHVPGQRVKTSGGSHAPAHPDAIKVATSKQTAKKSSTDALSTKDLQELVTRMNLQQQLARLQPPSKKQQAMKFVTEILVNVGKQQATKFASDFATKQIEELLKKGAKAAVKEAVA